MIMVVFVDIACGEKMLFESATLGVTGITEQQRIAERIPGTNLNAFGFSGVRFGLTQPSVTTRVGGHFTASDGGGGTFFGAIVSLESPDDLPDSSDLSTPDVLGSTLLEFPQSSADVYGELSLELQPGWYGVVFGSGLFDASGGGATINNNLDINTPDFIGRGTAGLWGQVPSLAASGQRFAVLGSPIPEPSTLLSLTLMLIGCCGHFARHLRAR